MSNEIIKLLTKEHDILREELTGTIDYQLKIYHYAYAALGLILSYIIVEATQDAIHIVPFFTMILALRWTWDIGTSVHYSIYISDLEIRISKIMNKEGKTHDIIFPIGWQINWYLTDNKRKKGWFFSAVTMFVFPNVIWYFYCLDALGYDKLFNINKISLFFYSTLVFLIVAGIYCIDAFFLYEKLHNSQIEKIHKYLSTIPSNPPSI